LTHAAGIGDDVVDRVGCDLGGIERDRADGRAIDEEPDSQIEVDRRAGDRGAQVGIAVANLDNGGVGSEKKPA